MKLRVFEVLPLPATAPKGTPPPCEERDSVVITAEGDAARESARTYLAGVWTKVRSINFSPGSTGRLEMIAYVQKG